MSQLQNMLQYMVENEGSDLYLTFAAIPSIKKYGKIYPIPKLEKLQAKELENIIFPYLNDKQLAEFQENFELNVSIFEKNIGRFRLNLFKQRNHTAAVLRSIRLEVPEFEKLGLPPILSSLIMEKRGLILFVGATGSGKSTSVASLIDYRNKNSCSHIITIEDPIEYLHEHKKCIVSQREVGVDTNSYEQALKNTLRQSPDVVLIGEIRCKETMEHALSFAETGHLCLSTLHANNADQALDRILHFFPEEKYDQLLMDLSFNLKAVISQRLINTLDNKHVPAIEVLLATPLVSKNIQIGKFERLKEIMEKSEIDGMQTFDENLYELYNKKIISYEEAIRNADSKNNLRLKIATNENPNYQNLEAAKPSWQRENISEENEAKKTTNWKLQDE